MADVVICLPDCSPRFCSKARTPPFTVVPLPLPGSEVAHGIYTESRLGQHSARRGPWETGQKPGCRAIDISVFMSLRVPTDTENRTK